MARDAGLEEVMRDLLADIGDLVEKPMFGGLAWLLDGHLLCAVRADGALVRLGKGNDAEALAMEGIAPMVSRGRPMPGWVWVAPELLGEEEIVAGLIGQAVGFVRSLSVPLSSG